MCWKCSLSGQQAERLARSFEPWPAQPSVPDHRFRSAGDDLAEVGMLRVDRLISRSPSLRATTEGTTSTAVLRSRIHASPKALATRKPG